MTIHTDDAFESRITKKEDLPSRALATAKFLNPQTGPIYVQGAEPGDTLAVRIESIEPTRDFAVSVLIPYFGGLTSTNFTAHCRSRCLRGSGSGTSWTVAQSWSTRNSA